MLEADDVEQLIAAVYSDAFRIGPTADAIVSWSADVIEKERRRRARTESTEVGFMRVDGAVHLHLEWRAGVIDPAASRVGRPAPRDAWRADRRNESEEFGPYSTGAKPYEIAREATATGKSIEQVARKLGAPLADAGNLDSAVERELLRGTALADEPQAESSADPYGTEKKAQSA